MLGVRRRRHPPVHCRHDSSGEVGSATPRAAGAGAGRRAGSPGNQPGAGTGRGLGGVRGQPRLPRAHAGRLPLRATGNLVVADLPRPSGRPQFQTLPLLPPIQPEGTPMLTVNAYAATSATEPLVPTTIERRDLGPHDVLIEIAYAGICHSDIHTVRGEWGDITYPLTVGHEIVGEVAEVGAEVTKHAVGDRVGVGCMVNSCRECANCLAGEEQYCLTRQHRHLRRRRPRRHDHPGRLLHPRRGRRGLRAARPGPRSRTRRPRRCCAPASPPTRRSRTGRPGPASRSPSSASAASATWPSRSPHAMGAEVTVLSQTLSKKEDGLAARRRRTTTPPAIRPRSRSSPTRST